MIFATNTTVTIDSSADTLSLTRTITTSGHTLTKSGTGTLTISGPQNHSNDSNLCVTAGTLNLNSNAGAPSFAVLNLSASGGNLNFNVGQDLASLALGGANAFMRTIGDHLLTDSFSLTVSSTLDLARNDLIVDYTDASPLGEIRTDLSNGYNRGGWNGKGIVSSAAASNSAHTTALGYAEASDVFGLTGSQTARVDGETVDDTTVLVKYTWIGDANLDGVVNAADLAMIQPTGATWSTGDFNYDGVVNADDYALFQLGSLTGTRNISTILPEPPLISILIGLTLAATTAGAEKRIAPKG